MLKRLRLWYWKRELLAIHESIECWQAAHGVDCGHAMLCQCSFNYREKCRDFNRALRKVKELDPACKVGEIEGV